MRPEQLHKLGLGINGVSVLARAGQQILFERARVRDAADGARGYYDDAAIAIGGGVGSRSEKRRQEKRRQEKVS